MPDYERHAHLTKPPSRQAPLDPATRQFNDADGVRWRVREMRRSDRAPALYFESDASFRRVTSYPLDWHDLTAPELESLSHSR
jgi:hypothetical protein